jgi:beta-glucosidase
MNRSVFSIFSLAAGLLLAQSAFASDTKPLAPPPAAAWPSDADFAVSRTVHPDIWPKGKSGVARDPAIEAEVARLVAQMTLEEKVGQIIQADIAYVAPKDVRTYHLGSVLNGGSSGPYGNDRAPAADWLKLADEFYAASTGGSTGKPKIPVIWGMDAVHGNTNIIGATIFPHNIGLGAMRDVGLMRKIGEITAEEVRIVGGDWTFAPTVAVVQNDRWGRTYESYAENPALVAEYAKAIVEGIQGKPADPDFLKGPHVIATAKHFLGDGGTDNGHDQGDNLYSEPALRDVFSPPYRAAIEAGVQTVMASFSSWRGNKMHGSRAFLNDILVDRFGFDGFVVGDWNGHAQVQGCDQVHCPQAVNAGLDMFMAPDGWKKLYENTLAEVKAGTIPEARLDEAVARILRVKLRAGVIDAPKPSARPLAGRFERLGSPEHRAVARQAVRESLVLLKNDGRALPLNPKLNVLVAGPGADDMTMQSGGWTVSWQGDGNSRADYPHADTIFDGIRAAVQTAGGTAVLSIDGRFKTKPDVAIVVFGEPPYAETRGDRTTVNFQGNDRKALRLLLGLKEKGIPVVAVLLSGRPLYVTPEINAADAFVAAFLPGGEGAGIADVLFAAPGGTPRYDFSGKLSFSWPRAPDQTPLNLGSEPYYPLFPYGYGLSYAAPRNLGRLPEAAGDAAAEGAGNFIENGRAAAAWTLALTGPANVRVPLDRTPTETPGGFIKASRIDRLAQEDSLALEWAGQGKADLVLFGPPANVQRQLKEDFSLNLIVRIDAAPDKPVTLAMGYRTFGELNVTGALTQANGKGWVKLRVRLSCLAKAGANLDAVAVPLRLSTEGKLSLALYSARLDIGPGKGCVTISRL